jgi:hypothetical protein
LSGDLVAPFGHDEVAVQLDCESAALDGFPQERDFFG